MDSTDTALRDQDIAHDQNIPALSPSGTKSLEGSKPKNQILVLDGVRAIACLAVLLFHVHFIGGKRGMWSPLHDIHDLPGILTYLVASFAYSGYSGVILFFILSGFLLFLPYAKLLLFDSPWPSLRRFYLRRIFRILPGYYVAIFFMALFFHSQFLHYRHWHDLWLFLTFRMDSQ